MEHPTVDIDDDDTADSLDGLVASVVDSLGDEALLKQARPTSAPPVEGNSISQSLFLGERQRTDSIQEFLTKSPGQMLGGGIRKRATGQQISNGQASFDDVLGSFPQISLSSPTSPLGNMMSASRFDFLDRNLYAPKPVVAQPPPPPQSNQDSIHHQRSLSQGNYGFQLGPGLFTGIPTANGSSNSSTTPHSSPPLSEVGDALLEDRSNEVETVLQLQIEDLQRQLFLQRHRKQNPQNQQIPQQMSQTQQPPLQQQQMPNQSRGPFDWSLPGAPNGRPLYPSAYVGPAPSPINGNGTTTIPRFDQFSPPLQEEFRPFPNGLAIHKPNTKVSGMVSPSRNGNASNNGFTLAQISTPLVPTNGTFVQHFTQDKLPVDAPLEQLEGRFLQLAQEQNGCRYLQQRIAREGPSGASLVLREVFPHLVQLMMDPFANYMYQKLLEHAAPEQRLQMLEAVQASLYDASLNLHGTRSVQKHIEMGGHDPLQRDIIARELSPFVTELSMDTNGNHVVQRMLQHLEKCDFVCDAIIRDLLIVTRHRHGCCVVQRCLDAADSHHRALLVRRIEENALQLMQDPFANYTVQYVIENGDPREGLRIVELIRGKIESLSKQKFSSNVVEKCIAAAPPHLLQEFVNEAIDCMGDLLHDAFANFVAQKLLDPITSDEQARAIVAAMRPHLLDLNPSCSRRVANRITKRFPDLANDEVVHKVLGGLVTSIPQNQTTQVNNNSMFRGHHQQQVHHHNNHHHHHHHQHQQPIVNGRQQHSLVSPRQMS